MDEFKNRFAAAKAHRDEFISEAGREVYKFCFNGREAEWDDTVKADSEPEEIFTDFPSTVAEEFYGELFSTMTPENAPWVEYEAGNAVDEDNEADAKEQLTEFEGIMAKSVRASNYYDEGQTAFQDAVVGTVALWVERPTLNSPVTVRAVPISKLFLRLGPFGIDDRFYRERYFYRDLRALFPTAKFSRDLQKKINTSARGRAKVIWGFWKTYKDPENPTWRQEIRVDDEKIGLDTDLGEDGSCPLVVGRFNAIGGSAWGRGPGVRMLPSMRVLDEISRMNLEGMDRNLDPPFTYPHDGMLDLSDGIESGMGYPAMPGSADAIKALPTGELDYGFFSEERLHEIVRYGFYRELEQRGKTPPSASQYLGNEQKQLRRIARPAAKTWREIGVGLLKRFEYLERQPGGRLDGVQIPLLDSGAIVARPISPLERAQAREDVLVAQSIMGMVVEGLGAEGASVLIKGPDTFRNIKSALKDKLVEFNSEKEIQRIMQMMRQQNAQPQE